MPQLPETDRTRLRRLPKRGTRERVTIDAVLDEAFHCHVGFDTPDGPVVVPTACWRIDDHLYLHGAASSRALRALAAGVAACVTVTHLDGLVLARSAFHHSMNYRSVMLFGTLEVVPDDEVVPVLRAFVEHVAPGRWDAIRAPSPAELKATTVLRLAIAEGSAKIRSGPPVDDEEDLALPVWAGVVPIRRVKGSPERDGNPEAG